MGFGTWIKSKLIGQSESKAAKVDGAEKVIVDSSPFYCPICLSVFSTTPFILPCGHTFCLACINRQITTSLQLTEKFESIFECALCRRPCSSSVKLAKNYIVDAIIQSVIDIGNDGSVPVLDDNLLFINKRLNKELRDAERLNLELHESLEREKNLKDLAILCICGIVSSVFIIYWWC